MVSADPVIEPASVYLFDRKAGSLTKMYTGRPELVGAPLVPMWRVEIPSRDGLTLPSYLTLPAGADANRDGLADRPVPMVLLVHGGPWACDNFGYNSYHQWLANRGYAVLSVNYRGSTGFGKNFITASNLQWGKKMHEIWSTASIGRSARASPPPTRSRSWAAAMAAMRRSPGSP